MGRTTHRVKSPMKAPAAAMAIILGLLRIRCMLSIAPGCYAPFTYLLNVCYTMSLSELPRIYFNEPPGLSAPHLSKKENPAPRPRGATAADRPATLGPSYLFFMNLRGRITQRANSPTNAAAAAMAIIPSVPPNQIEADYGIALLRLFYMNVKCLLQGLTGATDSTPGLSGLQ